MVALLGRSIDAGLPEYPGSVRDIPPIRVA
jgi:hypothetical protein